MLKQTDLRQTLLIYKKGECLKYIQDKDNEKSIKIQIIKQKCDIQDQPEGSVDLKKKKKTCCRASNLGLISGVDGKRRESTSPSCACTYTVSHLHI